MDVNIDQANPTDDFIGTDEGKYFYRTDTGEFDFDKFNLKFDQYKERRDAEKEKNMQEKLAKLNKPKKIIPIYGQPIGQVLIDTKNSLFELLDDILQGEINPITFTKNHRLFYIGLVLLFIAIFMYIITIVTNDSDNNYNRTGGANNILHVNHIHRICKINK